MHGTSRPSLREQLGKAQCRILAFVGRGAWDHELQLDAYGAMNVHTSTMLEFDSGGSKRCP